MNRSGFYLQLFPDYSGVMHHPGMSPPSITDITQKDETMDYDQERISLAISRGQLCGYLNGLIRTIGPAEMLRTVADSLQGEIHSKKLEDSVREEIKRLADAIPD